MHILLIKVTFYVNVHFKIEIVERILLIYHTVINQQL